MTIIFFILLFATAFSAVLAFTNLFEAEETPLVVLQFICVIVLGYATYLAYTQIGT